MTGDTPTYTMANKTDQQRCEIYQYRRANGNLTWRREWRLYLILNASISKIAVTAQFLRLALTDVTAWDIMDRLNRVLF